MTIDLLDLIEIRLIDWDVENDGLSEFLGEHPVGTFRIDSSTKHYPTGSVVSFEVTYQGFFLTTTSSIAEAMAHAQRHVNQMVRASIVKPSRPTE